MVVCGVAKRQREKVEMIVHLVFVFCVHVSVLSISEDFWGVKEGVRGSGQVRGRDGKGGEWGERGVGRWKEVKGY